MSTINDYFENIIGFSYTDNPTLFILYTLVIIWFLYQAFSLLYKAFRIKWIHSVAGRLYSIASLVWWSAMHLGYSVLCLLFWLLLLHLLFVLHHEKSDDTRRELFMNFILWVKSLLGTAALLEGETGIAAILAGITSIISAMTTAMTSLTTWILADPLAIMFFSLMFIMLAVHLIHSLVHKFS